MTTPHDWMRDVPITRLRVAWSPTAAVDLGRWPANGLRGALGRALWALACVNPRQECPDCPHVSSCLIPNWFDPSQLPQGNHDARPFALWAEPREHDAAPIAAEILFIGEVPRPSLLLEALDRMGRTGFGYDRVPCTLHRVVANSVVLWDQDPTNAPFPDPRSLADAAPPLAPDQPTTVTLRTPVQLPRHRAADTPRAADVLDAGISRLRGVIRALGLPQPPRWPEVTDEHASANLLRVERARTASGGGLHDLSGYVGELRFTAPVAPWADLLRAMSVLGAGRSTSAGLGRTALHQPSTHQPVSDA